MSSSKRTRIVTQKVEPFIITFRGERVIMDSDLARIYGVTTSRLNEQVQRNIGRFPEDFAFRLTKEEYGNLISQFATSSSQHGGRRKLPYVFTEHGAIMAANVLNSSQAVQMSVFVVRAFVKMREVFISNKSLAEKLDELEKKLIGRLDKQGATIVYILAEMRKLMAQPKLNAPKKRPIGFGREEE